MSLLLRDILPKHFVATEARVHGNGFVQMETTWKERKLHIWLEDCPRQERPSLIHDHNHGFSSFIVAGCLHNREYEVADTKTSARHLRGYHRVWSAHPRDRKDTGLHDTGVNVYLQESRNFWLTPGSTYTFPTGLLHETIPHYPLHQLSPYVITLVRRNYRAGDGVEPPRVLTADGIAPDDAFDRYGHMAYCQNVYEWLKTADIVVPAHGGPA